MKRHITRISLQKLRYFMLGINIIAALFIMLVIYTASQIVCVEEKAGEFLETVERLPANPLISLYSVCILCTCFFATFFIRQVIFVGKRTMVYITLLIDTLLNIVILIVMDYNYDGFLLWLLASIIIYIEGS
ncbi:MAG: hypothetical protein K6E51_01865, partial [Treponema sp.]|nr:hypothetical protein [Treponema sp.]